MIPDLQLKSFQQIIEEFKAHDGLHTHISLTYKQKITRKLTGGKWSLDAAYSLEATGDVTKMNELQKALSELKQKAQANPADFHEYIYKNFGISYKLSNGDMLPKFEGLTRVFEGNVTSLQHKQGQVLLIDVWATWCGPCQMPMQHNQDMLVKNAATWKDRVRIVGVSVDEDLGELKDRIETKGWKNVQHLTLGKWDEDHNLIKMFEINGIPIVILVGPDGRIDYVGYPSSMNLEQRINQLLKKSSSGTTNATSTEISSNVEKPGPLSAADFEIALKAIENPALDQYAEKMESDFEISITKIWRSRRGVEDVSASKLEVNFDCDHKQEALYREVLDTVAKGLDPTLFQADAYVKGGEAQFNYHYAKASEIFKRLGGKGQLQVTKNCKMNLADFKEDGSWKWSAEIEYPNLGYDDITIDVAKSIFSEMNVYVAQNRRKGRKVDSLQPLVSKFPINPLGKKLGAIPETTLYADRTVKLTPKHDGKSVWMIAVGIEEQESSHHIDNILKVAKQLGAQVSIFADGHDPYPKAKEIETAWPNAQVLSGGLSFEVFTPFMIRYLENLIIVDKSGLVAKGGQVAGYEAIYNFTKAATEKGYEAPHTVPSELAQQIVGFGGSEHTKLIKQAIKDWDYQPVLKFEYQARGNLVSKVIAEVKARTYHLETVLSPAIKLFKQAGTVDLEEVKVFKVPSGTICDDCQNQLKLPYHYYYWSKVWRCVPCATKSFKDAINQMKKFVHPENSVLVFAEDSELDLKRLGQNIQPNTEEQARQAHRFGCNGCRQGPNFLVRYICGGCKREPGTRDFNDFCQTCVMKIVHNDQQAKKLFEERNQEDGHKCTHPLVRVNFHVKSYYDY